VAVIRVETLVQGGAEVAVVPSDPQRTTDTDAAPRGTGDPLVRLVESTQADLLLEVVYGGVREITVVCTVYDPASGGTTGPVYETAPLSLTFDETVEALIDAALAPYADRLYALRRAVPERQAEDAVAVEETAPEPATAASTAASTAAGAPTPHLTPAVQPEPTASPTRRTAGIAVSTGAFVPLAGGARYLSIGAVQSADVSFILPGAPWLGVGLEGSFALFDAAGASAGSRVYLVPVGPALRLASYSSSPARPVVALAGGGSLVSVDPNGTGRLWKLVGYVAGATGVGLTLGERFSLLAVTRVQVFFEPGRPIVAFVPSVSAELRL
jgi:hypothetical protein